MFDAKSLLENLVRGAAPASQQQAGGGGLADILGQVLQGAGGASQSGGGGLGDVLGQLQRSLGAQQSGGGGGLGDILGQLQNKLGQGSHAVEDQTGAPGGGASGGLGDILGQLQKSLGQSGAQGGGGLMDVLTQVLTQASAGVKEGAGRLDQATGASDALGRATGQTPAEVLAKLQELARQNPMAAGGAMGGLGGLLLGTRTGRSIAGSAVKLGALAMIGGLAYKAFQNYQTGKPLIAAPAPAEAAPAGSGFEPAAITNESATLYIKAMVAAAAADGRVDAAEQQKLIGALKQAGLDKEAEQFLANEFNNPATPAQLADAVTSPEEAVQVYTAARIAVEPDDAGEKVFLKQLADALGIDAKLAGHIEAQARSAPA